jgi:transcriptional regulator with XRE-family HTH domain
VSRAKRNASIQPAWASALGARLRDVRAEQRLTLAAVSESTGISTSFLSLLESGRTDVSLGRLLPLLELYGLSAADVLSWDGSHDDGLVRAGEAPHLMTVAKGIELFLAAPDRRRPFLPVLAVYEPGARMRGYSEHEGDEFFYMLEGALQIDFRGEEPIELHTGDGIFFTSRRPHRFATVGDERARALIITTESLAT